MPEYVEQIFDGTTRSETATINAWRTFGQLASQSEISYAELSRKINAVPSLNHPNRPVT